MGGRPRLSPPDWPRMMRKSTASAYLDMSDAAFQRAVDAGELPSPVQLGDTILWSRPALDKSCENMASEVDHDWRQHAPLYRRLRGQT